MTELSAPMLSCARVPITASGPTEAAAWVVQRAVTGGTRGVDVHLCNAYTLALADKQAALRRLLNEAGANFADGQSVVWANRLRHRAAAPPTARVYGPDLFLNVCDAGRRVGLRHYLLGSTSEVLDSLCQALTHRFPGVQIVGREAPPFHEVDEIEHARRRACIKASGAQVVWVGLGTPKQDWEAARLAHHLPVVAVGVGAAFDFVAGTKPQAPRVLQRHGLEWTFRLATEPRRLWRRYLFGNVRFVYAAAARSAARD